MLSTADRNAGPSPRPRADVADRHEDRHHRGQRTQQQQARPRAGAAQHLDQFRADHRAPPPSARSKRSLPVPDTASTTSSRSASLHRHAGDPDPGGNQVRGEFSGVGSPYRQPVPHASLDPTGQQRHRPVGIRGVHQDAPGGDAQRRSRGSLHQQPPAVHHTDPAADRLDLGEQVAGQETPWCPSRVQLTQQRPHPRRCPVGPARSSAHRAVAGAVAAAGRRPGRAVAACPASTP